MHRVAVYLRISVDHTGEERAVERQREDALRLIRDRCWELFEEYVDNSISASKATRARPAYNRMLSDYRAGLFSVIVCYNLDRLTRQPAQLEQWIEAAEKRGLILVTLNGEADLSTDDGRLFARIKAVVARAEIERMGARRKRSNEQSIAAGRPAPGRRPFGWEIGGVTVRPHEAKVVRVAYLYVLHGGSMRRLVRHWNAAGVASPQGTPWTAFKVRQLLDRKRNMGVLERYGVEQPTSLIEPIISAQTFYAVQAIIEARTQPGRVPEKHLLSGLATCGTCGKKLGAKAMKTRGGRAPHYLCSSKINRNEHSDGRTHPAIRADILEGAVEEAVLAAFLFGSGDLFPGEDRGDLGELHVKLREIGQGRDRVVAAISRGSLKPRAADSQLAKLDREQVVVESAIAEAYARYASTSFADIRGGVFSPGRVKLDHVVEVRAALRENYRALSFDLKRQIIEALLAIDVETGYALKRVHIQHKIVTSLNEDLPAA